MLHFLKIPNQRVVADTDAEADESDRVARTFLRIMKKRMTISLKIVKNQ